MRIAQELKELVSYQLTETVGDLKEYIKQSADMIGSPNPFDRSVPELDTAYAATLAKVGTSLRGKKRLSNFVILVLSLLISACSSTVPIRSPLQQAPLIEKAAISVAIHYAESFRNHDCTVSKGYIMESWAIMLGPPSIEMFDRIFSALFNKVIHLDSGVKVQAVAGQYPLIEVRLLEFDGCEASWPIMGSSIGVAYEATLYGTDGILIARLIGRGRAGSGDDLSGYKEAVPTLGVETTYLSAVTSLAMRRAAADFIINFEKDPGIRAWLGR